MKGSEAKPRRSDRSGPRVALRRAGIIVLCGFALGGIVVIYVSLLAATGQLNRQVQERGDAAKGLLKDAVPTNEAATKRSLVACNL